MNTIKLSNSWHRWLVWPAFIAVLIYVLSAMTHPLMAWTGPQAKVMFPPSLNVTAEQANALPLIVEKYDISSAKVVKLVPSAIGVLLQITESEITPRRYFDLSTQQELLSYDEKQAVWLGQHYLKADHEIASIQYVTEFRQDYPSVNRLLPVYKINYRTEDNLSVFVHTETLALAGVSNNWKESLRSIFQAFHTFSWLNDFEVIRLLIVFSLVFICFLMGATGFVLLTKIRRKQAIKNPYRRWHRRIAWAVFLPLIMFSLSGLYHLIHSTLSASEHGLRLTRNIDPTRWPSLNLSSDLEKKQIHQVSLVENMSAKEKSNRYLYRLSISQEVQHSFNTRAKRFRGQASEKQAIYINAKGEQVVSIEQALISEAAKALSMNGSIESMAMISRFGPSYDFRNKRLPVWQVDLDNGHRYFIDPVSLILVDQNRFPERLERTSFSFLHKWNMLVPLTGRYYRDVVIVTVLSLTLLISLIGLAARYSKRSTFSKETTVEKP